MGGLIALGTDPNGALPAKLSRSSSMNNDSEHKVSTPPKKVHLEENGISKEEEDAESHSPTEAEESNFRQLVQKSSFYGLRYVFGSELKVVEKLIWLVVILAAIACYSILMVICWKRLTNSLVEIIPDEDPSPISSVPFPAVTICGQWGDAIPDDRKSGCLARIVPLERFCSQICWHNQCDVCRSLFTETLTENGACFTFNNVAANDLFNSAELAPDLFFSNASKPTENWSLQNGYADYGLFLKYYPRPAVDLSEKYRLRLKLHFNQTSGNSSCPSLSAVTVYLHNPVDFPYKAKSAMFVEPGQKVDVSIKPLVKLSPNVLKYYPAESAKCYFEGQRKLRFFKIYTQENCELECRTNYFLEKKKCVLAYMPRAAGTKLCRNSFQWEDQFDKDALLLAKAEKFPLSKYFVNTCKCLPSCSQIGYDKEVSQTVPDGNFSDIVIHYTEDYFYGYKRTIRYGLVDFIAYTGGLLSLFLGISAITFIELLYYCMLRPLFM
ncbi:pickpocket protein 28-like [Sabethes cyaneus]|uniref:pickpocket protein 28-like n=1 Tax=Sabethes cyaneus TaxID=53552 RepID=UPI00237D5BCA|nr:pickpocket protein 28-like [Sabethes cyaneus]